MSVKYDNVDRESDTEKSSISNSYYVGGRSDTYLYKPRFLNIARLEHTLTFSFSHSTSYFYLKR